MIRSFPEYSGIQQSAHVISTWDNSPILTKQQAAKLLGCTERYLERQIRAGRLRACKPTGKFVRILRKDIDAFLESCASIPITYNEHSKGGSQ